MKHAAVKDKPAAKIAKIERTIAVRKSVGAAKKETVSPSAKTKTKAVGKTVSASQKTSSKEKVALVAVVVSKPKPPAAKTAPVSLSSGKNAPSAKKIQKTATVKTRIKVAGKKVEPTISAQANKLAKEPAKFVAAPKIKPRTQESEANETAVTVVTETHRIAAAINVGRINAALKAIEEAQLKANRIETTEKKDRRKSAKMQKLAIAEAETKAAAAKTKPKIAKQIGAAVFRGRKNRYDFQVFPLDFEFENVPAIYVISRRKTDSKKRAHHALVCIGQTDSVMNELKKHTQSKCVTKHEANVISILPERSEKKRLKIEEDLRAAHAIVCNVE